MGHFYMYLPGPAWPLTDKSAGFVWWTGFSGSGSLVADMLRRFYLQTPKIRKDKKFCIRTKIADKPSLSDKK